MKTQKLYVEPTMKFHKLSTSRLMEGSPSDSSDPDPIHVNPNPDEGEVGGGD